MSALSRLALLSGTSMCRVASLSRSRTLTVDGDRLRTLHLVQPVRGKRTKSPSPAAAVASPVKAEQVSDTSQDRKGASTTTKPKQARKKKSALNIVIPEAPASVENEGKKSSGSGKRLPTGVTDLLQPRSDTDRSFPRPVVIAKMVRNTYLAGCEIEVVEEWLIKKHSPKRKKLEHHSKYAVGYWKKGDREKALDKLGELLRQQITSGKERMPIKRVEFFLTVFRLCQVMSEASGDGDADSLRRLDQLCDEAAVVEVVEISKNPTLTPAFFLWVTLIKSGSPENIRMAKKLLEKHPSLIDYIGSELNSYGKNNSREDLETLSKNPTLPTAFSFGDVEEFCRDLSAVTADADEVKRQQLECQAASLFWHTSRYSAGLKRIVPAMEYLVENFQSDDIRLYVGPVAVTTFSEMLSEAAESVAAPERAKGDTDVVRAIKEEAAERKEGERGKGGSMTLVLDLVDSLSGSLSRGFPTTPPLIPYLLWIQLTKAGLESRAKAVLNKYPKIQELRHEKLEKALTMKDATVLGQSKTARKFLEECTLTIPDDSSSSPGLTNMPPELRRDMLDLEVLQALKADLPQAGLEAVAKAAANSDSKEALISVDALTPLVKACLKDYAAHEEALNALKLQLPPKSDESNTLLKLVRSHRLKTNHFERWLRESRCEALSYLVGEYRAVLSEDAEQVTFSCADAVLRRLREFFRMYLEEGLLNRDHPDGARLVETAEAEAKNVSATLGDHSLLVTIWEALFFPARGNPTYSSKRRADDFLAANPAVPKSIDVDRAIGMANEIGAEEVFRDLLEICLTYDLGDYEKTRAFEALLVFQSRSGRVKAAQLTLQGAKDIDIRIGAEAMNIYLTSLRQEEEPKAGGNIVQRISEFFSTTPKRKP